MRAVLHLSWIDTVSWIAGAAFEVALVALILLRKPSRQVYLFSVYFVFLLAQGPVVVFGSALRPEYFNAQSSRLLHHLLDFGICSLHL